MPKQTQHIFLLKLSPKFRRLPVLTACSVMALTALPSSPTAAQVGDSLNACAQISAAEQRLACYDKLSGLSDDETSVQVTNRQEEARKQTDVEAQQQVEPSPVQANTQADTAEAVPDSRRDTPTLESFGRDSNPAQARIQRNDKSFELIDKVVDLQQYHHARLEIRLSGGQLWRQTAARRFHLNEGDEVRIYPSDFGTDYRLSAKGRSGFIQVQRIE